MDLLTYTLQLIHASVALWVGPPPDSFEGVAGEITTSGATDMAVKAGSGRFLYFAYGSNLLAERLRINNPSAQRVTIGNIENYRLDFGYMSPRWGGHAATIVPDPGRNVWGAVWSLAEEDLDDLDRQEGVGTGVYVPVQVNVHSMEGNILTCRSYHLREQPSSPLPEGQVITKGHEPSKIYWQVIMHGAHESGLPNKYIEFLKTIPHNDFMGNFKIGKLAEALEEINTPLNNE